METTNNTNETELNQPQHWEVNEVSSKSLSFSSRDDDDKKTEEQEKEEQDSHDRDWGDVDPQEHPGRSSGMDPSGPGSAV